MRDGPLSTLRLSLEEAAWNRPGHEAGKPGCSKERARRKSGGNACSGRGMVKQYIDVLGFFILLLAGNLCAAGAADYSLGGYAKSYFYIFKAKSIDGATQTGSDSETLLSNRFRIQSSYTPVVWMRLNAAYDLAPAIHSRGFMTDSLFFNRIDPFSYRAVDLDARLYPSETPGRFTLSQNLDRASVTLRLPMADVTVGRQAIAWGSARVLNPTDVLAPFTFDALDTEDRIGVDAVRARIPIGTLSEIDLGYVLGAHGRFAESAFFARTVFNSFRTDISLIFMGFRENVLLGIDLARPVGGAGCWLETAYVFSGVFDTLSQAGGEDYFRATAGLDYNLTSKTYAFLEYHFNGAGASMPAEYMNRFGKTAYAEGSVYLLGRHYLVPGLSYQFHPLATLTMESLISLADPSLFLSPRIEYNFANDMYFSAGTFIGIGSGPVSGLQPFTAAPQSEFGAYPNIYFASLRHYF